MATHSTVPAVSAAIVSVVAPALPGVQVVEGRPADSLLQRECVYTGQVTGHHAIANIKAGRKQRNENYTIDVVCSVLQARGTVAAARNRAYELVAAVEDALANDPFLGAVDGLIAATAGGFRDVSDFVKEGPAAVVVLEVECSARLI